MGEYEHCLDTVQERRKRAAFQYRVTRDPDDGRRMALLEEMLRPYGILEEVRTGAIALQHGTEVL